MRVCEVNWLCIVIPRIPWGLLKNLRISCSYLGFLFISLYIFIFIIISANTNVSIFILSDTSISCVYSH